MSFGGILVQILFILTLLCILTVIFVERKNPTSSIAWILVLSFLPGLGIVLYLFIGSGFKINKRRKYANKAAVDDLYNNTLIKHLNVNREEAFLAKHEDAKRLLTYLERQGEGVFTNDNQAEIFTNGADMFKRLLADIKQAQHSVHMLFYIFRSDSIGNEIIAALAERARQGVEVRLIYDSVGSLLSTGKIFAELAEAGGQISAFSPLFSNNWNSSFRLNYRNHRKIVVIDGVVGYLGGMNVGDEYRSMNAKLAPWRDTHLRLLGSSAWFLQERFFMDWCYSKNMDLLEFGKLGKYFPTQIGGGTLGVQIVSSGPDAPESPIKAGILSMLYSAQKNVFIQSPYLAPDQSILDALDIAAESGVDVRLMIPKLSDHWIVNRATYGYARQILQSGVKVFQYDGFLHAKTIVVDGKTATIGTTNMTNRSFTQNFEVNAFFHNDDFAAKCEEIFLEDQKKCFELTEDWFADRSIFLRSSFNFSRLLAPLI